MCSLASGEGPARPAVLAGALSRALCFINKTQRADRGWRRGRPRILCLKGSPDATEQYISVMNAIFAAQASLPCAKSASEVCCCHSCNQISTLDRKKLPGFLCNYRMCVLLGKREKASSGGNSISYYFSL